MRLTQLQIKIIKSTFTEVFGSSAQLLLFGSRTQDNLRGGDIDLYVMEFNCTLEQQLDAKLRFLVKVKQQMGECRIDLIFAPLPDQTPLPIHRIAEQTGIPL